MKPVRVIDISSWETNATDIVAMGRREKIAITNQVSGEQFYFKQSKDNYPHEFWSEIVASKFGQLLGFNVADYNVGVNGDTIASISDSVITSSEKEQQNLIHGQNFILAIYPDYETDKGEDHSFQLIEEVLTENDLHAHTDQLIEMVVFDALIGNNDRHQQNWAFIEKRQSLTSLERARETKSEKKKEKELDNKGGYAKWLTVLLILILFLIFLEKKTLEIFKVVKRKTNPFHKYAFAPLFDNGSSLGREILENRIDDFLSSKDKQYDYLIGNKKGFPHIRWKKERINHIELIKRVREKYPNQTNVTLNRCFQRFNDSAVAEMIEAIDNEVPEKFAPLKLSSRRKRLMITLLSERFNLLKKEFSND